MTKIVILTGAGISAESGLATFHDKQGLWAQHRIEDVAAPRAFARNPKLVHDFYNARRAQAVKVEPNVAHRALSELESNLDGDVLIITQNVDSPHEKAGSKNVIHMHGALDKALCSACGFRSRAPAVMSPTARCPRCHAPALRPDVVWFGEIPYAMQQISRALSAADIFVSIGTSGEVNPTANFVTKAAFYGAHTIELNFNPTASTSRFAERRFGLASELVPKWVAEELNR